MKYVYAFVLIIITAAIGQFAWEICMTINTRALGGYLPFAFFTFAPILFFGLGYLVREAEDQDDDFEHIVMVGETYYHR